MRNIYLLPPPEGEKNNEQNAVELVQLSSGGQSFSIDKAILKKCNYFKALFNPFYIDSRDSSSIDMSETLPSEQLKQLISFLQTDDKNPWTGTFGDLRNLLKALEKMSMHEDIEQIKKVFFTDVDNFRYRMFLDNDDQYSSLNDIPIPQFKYDKFIFSLMLLLDNQITLTKNIIDILAEYKGGPHPPNFTSEFELLRKANINDDIINLLVAILSKPGELFSFFEAVKNCITVNMKLTNKIVLTLATHNTPLLLSNAFITENAKIQLTDKKVDELALSVPQNSCDWNSLFKSLKEADILTDKNVQALIGHKNPYSFANALILLRKYANIPTDKIFKILIEHKNPDSFAKALIQLDRANIEVTDKILKALLEHKNLDSFVEALIQLDRADIEVTTKIFDTLIKTPNSSWVAKTFVKLHNSDIKLTDEIVDFFGKFPPESYFSNEKIIDKLIQIKKDRAKIPISDLFRSETKTFDSVVVQYIYLIYQSHARRDSFFEDIIFSSPDISYEAVLQKLQDYWINRVHRKEEGPTYKTLKDIGKLPWPKADNLPRDEIPSQFNP